MPTTTYTPIASVTLSASASEVVFSGLPQTYRDLILVFNGQTSAATQVRIQMNGDTASNYSLVWMRGEGSTTNSTAVTGSDIELGYTPSNTPAMLHTQLLDYSATDKHKTLLSRGLQTGYVIAVAGRWASTTAVSSIRLFPTSGTLNSGSTFNLFGIVS